MPDLYLHATFAQEVAQQIDFDISNDLLLLGAQGPDPMYYAIFHKESTRYRNLADRMHDTSTREHLITLVQSVKQHNTIETYSFLVGYLCHYALDVTIHPYVYYNVGVYDQTIAATKEYRGLHLKFERSIDAALMTEALDKAPHKIPLQTHYMPVKQPPVSIQKLMEKTIKNVYGKEDGDIIYKNSVKAMYTTLKRFINDRFGIKKQLYKLIDLFHKNDMFLSDLSFYKHLDDYDYLNETNQAWYHPVTNEKKTASIADLYKEALSFATSLIQQVDQYLEGNNDIDLTTVFTNLSFNSGVVCDHKEPMKHFKNYTK